MSQTLDKTLLKPFGAGLRQRLWRVSLLSGALLAGVMYWQLGLPGAPRPAATVALAAIPVTSAAVITRDMPIWLTGIGSVVPLNAVDVKVRVDGQLQSLAFAEGQEVTVGQLLAKIDPRPYQATLAQAEANRKRDMAQYANARQEVARSTKLAQAGAGTSQSLDTVKAQADALQATLEADQATIDAAKLNLSFTNVVSPLAGRVGIRNADVGAIVRASDATGLVTVTQIVPIAVQFALPQDMLAEIMRGQGQGGLPVAVDTRDDTRHLADGRLTFINSTVDQTTGQIQMKAEFANVDRKLWPGQFVSARILLRTDHGAAVVPSQAVQTGQNGPYVYVIQPDQTVTPQPVTIGVANAGQTQIVSGLSPGQTVVVSGQFRIAYGTKVKATPMVAGS